MAESFHSAYYQANLLYDLEMTPEVFEEIGLIAWNKIGNKTIRLYTCTLEVGCPKDGEYKVELPCNCDEIEAVTYNWEDWKYTTNLTVNGDYSSQFTENYIEGRKLFEHPLYVSGKYAKYQRVGNTLYFDSNYGTVNVLYRGIVLDEDGLPEITEKEKDAIACYCAYVQKFKEGWRLNNQNVLQNAQLLEQRWLKLCDAARVPTHFTQNELNQILDAKASWNRKIFNKSYKPVK